MLKNDQAMFYVIFILIILSQTLYADNSSIDELEKLVGQSQTLEKFLEKLPSAYKENFTLLKSSNSMQGATASDPRAILFTRSKQWTALTFNGHEGQRGGDQIEGVVFDKDTARFVPFVVSPSISGSLELDKNPRTCIRCHGKDFLPIWDEYALWPRTYGSDDDVVTRDDSESLKAFWKKAAALHPRYQYLPQPPERKDRAYFPFLPLYTDAKSIRDYTKRPNSNLTTFLSDAVGLRAVKKIENSILLNPKEKKIAKLALLYRVEHTCDSRKKENSELISVLRKSLAKILSEKEIKDFFENSDIELSALPLLKKLGNIEKKDLDITESYEAKIKKYSNHFEVRKQFLYQTGDLDMLDLMNDFFIQEFRNDPKSALLKGYYVNDYDKYDKNAKLIPDRPVVKYSSKYEFICQSILEELLKLNGIEKEQKSLDAATTEH